MLVAELFSVGRDRHWLWQRWNRGAIGKAADGEAVGGFADGFAVGRLAVA